MVRVVVASSAVVVARVRGPLDRAAFLAEAAVWVGLARGAVTAAVTAAVAVRRGEAPMLVGRGLAGVAPSCWASAFTIPSPTGGPVEERSAEVSAATWDSALDSSTWSEAASRRASRRAAAAELSASRALCSSSRDVATVLASWDCSLFSRSRVPEISPTVSAR